MHELRLTGEQLGEGALAGAEIGDAHLGHEQEEHLADSLPGTAGAMAASEATGNKVEVGLGLTAAFFAEATQCPEVRLRLGIHAERARGGGEDLAHRGRQVGGQRVVHVLPVASVNGEAGLAQQREVCRDARLLHPEDFLQFAHSHLALAEEQEDARPGRVREES